MYLYANHHVEEFEKYEFSPALPVEEMYYDYTKETESYILKSTLLGYVLEAVPVQTNKCFDRQMTSMWSV